MLGSRLPSDADPRRRSSRRARADGDGNFADLLLRPVRVPGVGIDFGALGAGAADRGRRCTSSRSCSACLQGYVLNDVVQSTIRRLRSDVEAKLHRVPLDYVDAQPRGELLSRVTNDIDNIAQSLQQTLGQLLTSLLTVLGVSR